jgi:hypothetical protein
MCGVNWYIISRGISERTHSLNFMYRPNHYLFTYFLFISLFVVYLTTIFSISGYIALNERVIS